MMLAVLLPACDGCAPSLEPLAGMESLAVGWTHACALDAEGALWCWGTEGAGEQAVRRDHAERVEAGPLVGLDARQGTCVHDPAGQLRCRGPASAPADLCPVASAALGPRLACARCRDGAARCWEQDGARSVPVPFDAPAELAVGESHVCAKAAGGEVGCLYFPAVLQGRQEDVHAIALPAPAEELVAGGGDRFCARLEGGSVACWRGAKREASSVIPEGARALGAEGDRVCALSADAVRCLRLEEAEGASGLASAPDGEPVPVGASQALGVGASHWCVLSEVGGVRCRGVDLAGQLGDGPPAHPLPGAPVEVQKASE